MGYYSTLQIMVSDVKTTREKMEWFNKRMEENMDDSFESMRLVEDDGIMLVSIRDEYNGKFYRDKEFAFTLSKAIEEGEIILDFVGEDGEHWGYRVMPGRVMKIEYVPVEEEIKEETA